MSRRTHLAVWGFYFLVAALMTWPLVARLGSQVPAGVSDLWQNYWNLWWWKTALSSGQSPYATDLIFHPGETRLGLHTHSPANMLWTLPVNILFGVAAALNLATFAGFVLAAVGAFFLAREYTSSRLAALTAGLAFAYFPQHVEQALEHLNLASYYALPLFLWALVRTVRSGGRSWIATGLFFALNALMAWHNALFALTLGLGVAGFESWRSHRPAGQIGLDLARAAAVALVLTIPFLIPLIADTLAQSGSIQKPFSPRAIEPLTLLLPHRQHPLWGETLLPLHRLAGQYRTAGGVGYLGWITAVLAMVNVFGRGPGRLPAPHAARAAPRGSRVLWLVLFLFFLVLALGSSLATDHPTLDRVTLPFQWLRAVPLFGLVRIPNRFLVPAMLSLAVLAAMGSERLLARFPHRQHRITAGVLMLMLVDYAWLPFPMQSLPSAPWLTHLEEVPSSVAVLDIPSGIRKWSKQDMVLQTLHGRPIATGFAASTPRRMQQRLIEYPALREVLFPYPRVDLANSSYSLSASIEELGIGLIFVHLDRTKESLHRARRQARSDRTTAVDLRRLPRPGFGMKAADLDRIRAELRRAFGPPFAATGPVEIYRVR